MPWLLSGQYRLHVVDQTIIIYAQVHVSVMDIKSVQNARSFSLSLSGLDVSVIDIFQSSDYMHISCFTQFWILYICLGYNIFLVQCSWTLFFKIPFFFL